MFSFQHARNRNIWRPAAATLGHSMRNLHCLQFNTQNIPKTSQRFLSRSLENDALNITSSHVTIDCGYEGGERPFESCCSDWIRTPTCIRSGCSNEDIAPGDETEVPSSRTLESDCQNSLFIWALRWVV